MPVVKAGKSDEIMDPPAGSALSADIALQEYTEALDEGIANALGAGKTATQEPAKEYTLPDNVTQEDKEEYVRSLLAGEPFSKSYELFGGNVSVTFRSRSVGENEKLRNSIAVPSAYNKHAMMRSLSLLQVQDKEITVLTETALREMSDILYSGLLRVFRKFEALCDSLYEMADDQNFWRGIGGRV